jgi:ligand-binding sensor domain-containing protein/DNA-binding CsgD family transcriptional regulator
MNNYYIIDKSIIIHLVLLLLASSAFAETGKYPIKNFSPADYEAGIQNIDFAQNRDMTLFVANNLGVLSFNGNDWEIHAYRTGKKQRSLAFDETNNRLYVGSQGDFGYFDNDWNYVSLVEKIPTGQRDFDEVWDVFIEDNVVYFCTFQGIYIYNGSAINVIVNESGFNRSFHLASKLFTQDSEGKLFEIKEGNLSPAYAQNKAGRIVSGLIAKDNGYLVFYNSGEIEFASSFGVTDDLPQLSAALEGKYVNHVTELSDTRLVIATQRSGLYLYDVITGEIENITVEDGLQGNACLRTFQDNSGNLWVGMQNGMALVDISSPMRLINQKIDLQGSGYEAFESDEGIYYTTSNGIYFLPEGGSKCTFLQGTEGPSYGVQKILNRIYAGHHTGLFLLEAGKARRIAATNGIWNVKQLKSNPKYAIGGTYSGLYLFRVNENQELEGVQRIKGFSESSKFFEEDNSGSIWVGQFYKGLYKLQLSADLKSANVDKVSDRYDLPIKDHIILSRIDNEIYIATERGIYLIDQVKDQIVEAEMFSEVVGKSWVYLLVQGSNKNIYIYTENNVGFYKQVSSNNYVYVPSSLFQLRHSFNNDLLNVSVNIQDGVMFNANEGFINYKSELEDRLSTIKEPLISRVYVVDDDSILFERLPFENKSETKNSLTITQGIRVLQFMVESFKFKDIGDRKFRYLLKGFDKDYSEWTDATIKEYTNLKEGDYEFYVQSLNSFGEHITSQPFHIKVEPPFYRTGFMKFIYFIIVVLIMIKIYQFQRQYYRRKQANLDRVRKEELSEKQLELQRLKDEKVQSELSHLNNLLAASTMNLVVKNEFMENIKEELKEVNLKAEISERRQALEKIVKEIDKTLKLQEDWQQFEYHFDRVHGDFLTRLTTEFTDLTPGEQKLCAFLRLKMDTKEIANLMAISLRGVEVARYRLRKKFNLETHQNLSKFILEY